MQGDCLPQRHTGLPRPPPIPGAKRRCRGIACRSGQHRRLPRAHTDPGSAATMQGDCLPQRHTGRSTTTTDPGSEATMQGDRQTFEDPG